MFFFQNGLAFLGRFGKATLSEFPEQENFQLLIFSSLADKVGRSQVFPPKLSLVMLIEGTHPNLEEN